MREVGGGGGGLNPFWEEIFNTHINYPGESHLSDVIRFLFFFFQLLRRYPKDVIVTFQYTGHPVQKTKQFCARQLARPTPGKGHPSV